METDGITHTEQPTVDMDVTAEDSDSDEIDEYGQKKSKAVKKANTLGNLMAMIQSGQVDVKLDSPQENQDVTPITLPVPAPITDDDNKIPESFGSAKVYPCEVCDVEMTSKEALEKHMTGNKHHKKVAYIEKGATSEQTCMEKTIDIGKVVFPGDLQKLLAKCEEPVIGGQHVVEYLSDNPTFEPKYSCTLCDVTGNIKPMYVHMIGQKHRGKVLQLAYGSKPSDKDALMKKVTEYEEQYGRELDEIQIITGDDKYPWSEGQLPSGVMKGKRKFMDYPSGQSNKQSRNIWQQDDYGQASWGSSSFMGNLQNLPDFGEDFEALSLSHGPMRNFLSMLSMCFVTNEEDARFALYIARTLTKSYLAYKMPKLREMPYHQRQVEMENVKVLLDFPRCTSSLCEVTGFSMGYPGGASLMYDSYGGAGPSVRESYRRPRSSRRAPQPSQSNYSSWFAENY